MLTFPTCLSPCPPLFLVVIISRQLNQTSWKSVPPKRNQRPLSSSSQEQRSRCVLPLFTNTECEERQLESSVSIARPRPSWQGRRKRNSAAPVVDPYTPRDLSFCTRSRIPPTPYPCYPRCTYRARLQRRWATLFDS